MALLNPRLAAAACVATLALSAPPAAAGDIVKNGGDAALCRNEPGAAIIGALSLDFLEGELTTGGAVPQVAFTTPAAGLDYIAGLLALQTPALAAHFAGFRRDLDNRVDPLRPRMWRISPHPLAPVDDVSLARLIPANCRETDPSSGAAHVKQTIVRTKSDSGPILYDADSATLDLLGAQAAYLYVHEWLWDFAEQAPQVRSLVYFLFSQRAATLSPRDFAAALERLSGGTLVAAHVVTPVCDRAPAIQAALEAALGKACYDVVAADLPRVYDLVVTEAPWAAITGSDLSGLVGLEELHAEHVGVQTIERGAFAHNQNLTRLSLSGNQLASLPDDVPTGAVRLQTLDLSHNAFVTIPATLRPTPWLAPLGVAMMESLDLSYNAITSLPRELLFLPQAQLAADRVTYPEINLAHNRLTHLPTPAPGDVLRESPWVDLGSNEMTDFPLDLPTSVPPHRAAGFNLDDNRLSPALQAQLNQLYPQFDPTCTRPSCVVSVRLGRQRP